jgi:WD40 repeat protein
MIGRKRKLEEYIKDNTTDDTIKDEFSEKRFLSIPKFKFMKNITKIIEYSGFNDIFDTYNLNDDPYTGYIAFKNKDGYMVIYRIKQTNTNGKIELSMRNLYVIKIKTLEQITMLRHFKNPYNGNHYIILADRLLMIYLYEIKNDEPIEIGKFKGPFGSSQHNSIYSCLMYFTPTDSFLVATRFCGAKHRTSLFDIKCLERSFKKVNLTFDKKTRYITQWFNKKDNIIYLIECFSESSVLIYEPFNESIYDTLEVKGDIVSACLSKSENGLNDYLIMSSSKPDNIVIVYDLIEKKEMYKINIKSSIFHIISWSNRYIIVADSDNMGFDVIDIYNGQIISRYVGHNKKGIKCIKKLKIGENEYLFSGGKDGFIKMWKNERNFVGEMTI